jgi:hypothetical protein
VIPAPRAFSRSRGLIAIITNDDLNGGTNFNANTMTANTLNSARGLATDAIQSDDTDNRRVRRRIPPDEVDMDLEDCINTVAQEFGHSFNLDDEYEEVAGDDADAFEGRDNVTTLQRAIDLPNWDFREGQGRFLAVLGGFYFASSRKR